MATFDEELEQAEASKQFNAADAYSIMESILRYAGDAGAAPARACLLHIFEKITKGGIKNGAIDLGPFFGVGHGYQFNRLIPIRNEEIQPLLKELEAQSYSVDQLKETGILQVTGSHHVFNPMRLFEIATRDTLVSRKHYDHYANQPPRHKPRKPWTRRTVPAPAIAETEPHR